MQICKPESLRESAPRFLCRRFVVPIALAMCTLNFAGCQTAGLFRSAPPIPTVLQGTPDASQLVAAIRRNTEAVRQLNSNVKVVMDGMPASATGSLLMERPSRMRLKVGVLGMTDSGIDIGSNDQRFWFFNKSSFGGARPTIFYANHDEYANSAMRQTIQLRPEWLMDAMGLVQFDPAEKIEGPIQKNGNLELFTTLQTSGGTVNRVLTVDPGTGVVLQQAIYDGNNRLLGWVRSSKHRYYPEHQASLPQHIELTAVGIDGRKMKLAVTVQSHTINSLYVDPAITWSMPQPADVPKVDLTRVDPATLQQSMAPATPVTDIDSGAYPTSRRRPFQWGRLRGFERSKR